MITAADDSFEYFFHCVSEIIRLYISCESSAQWVIHMKYQALFSTKDKSKKKKIKVLSAAIFLPLSMHKLTYCCVHYNLLQQLALDPFDSLERKYVLNLLTFPVDKHVYKGLGSIRAVFGLIFKITLIMSNDSKELVSLKNENIF